MLSWKCPILYFTTTVLPKPWSLMNRGPLWSFLNPINHSCWIYKFISMLVPCRMYLSQHCKVHHPTASLTCYSWSHIAFFAVSRIGFEAISIQVAYSSKRRAGARQSQGCNRMYKEIKVTEVSCEGLRFPNQNEHYGWTKGPQA